MLWTTQQHGASCCDCSGLFLADFVAKVTLTSDRWSTDKILFGVDSPPENPSALSKPGRNHFLASLARTSSRILLQQNLHQAYVPLSIADMPGNGGSAGTDLRLQS